MSDLVSVLHPVVHRYVPARARNPRIGVALATTSCRLCRFGEAPVEVARIGGERIYGADGAAWMALVDHGAPASEKRLRVLLEQGAAQTRNMVGYVEPFHREVARSPLHFRDDVSDRLPRLFEPTVRDKVVEDGSASAARQVQDYLHTTFRLHEGRVYTRFRHLVLAQELHRAAPVLQTRTYPRIGADTRVKQIQLGLRHDRIQDLIGLIDGTGRRGRISGAGPHDWRELWKIPASLLDDHDVEYAANALPELMSPLVAYWSSGEEVTREVHGRIRDAAAPLQRLVEDSWTHSITGARVETTLSFLGGILTDICEEQASFDRVLPTKGQRPVHVATALMRDMVNRVYLPRARMGRDIDPDDALAIAGLAM